MLFNSGPLDYSLLALRLALAAVFAAHGWMKVSKWKSIPAPFRFLGLLEVIGAFLVILGFLTHLSSIVFVIIMLGAMYHKIVKWKTPFMGEKGTGWELDLIILAAALVLIAIGPGNVSFDALWGFFL